MLVESARSNEERLHAELKSRIDGTLELHRNYFNKIMDSFQKLSSERIVRNTWDYSIDQWPVLFTDAMGAKHMLPFHLCTTYEVRDSLDTFNSYRS